MIAAKIARANASFTARLARHAALIAQAHGEMQLRRQRRDDARWRLPRLLWPLFTKGR